MGRDGNAGTPNKTGGLATNPNALGMGGGVGHDRLNQTSSVSNLQLSQVGLGGGGGVDKSGYCISDSSINLTPLNFVEMRGII